MGAPSDRDTVNYADGYSGPTSPDPALDPTGEVELVASADYELEEKLGQGGMGEVWKAKDHRLGRVVALKLLRAEASGPAVAAALLREARALARVEHPNVCRVYGVGEREGRAFLALQYVEGGATLTQVAPEMSREQLVRVIALVAEALHAAHRAGIVHRDIKPDNILIERSDGSYRPYVADFGVARILDNPEHTRTGVIKGTPQYMSPEQVRGEAWRIDRRSDVYALGVVLYEALARQRPFTGEGVAVMHQISTVEPVPPRRLDSSIPRDLELIALRCLEKDPERRYDSARSLAADLWAWIDGKPIHARPASAIYRVRKWTRRNLALSVAISLGAAAALVISGVLWNAQRIAREQIGAAQALGAEIAERDALTRFSAMLPLHDLRPERARTEAYIAELRDRLARATPATTGPYRYALGRAYLTIEQPEPALIELDRAVAAGYRPPELSYARGLAYFQRYSRRLHQITLSEPRETRAAKQRALDDELNKVRDNLRLATGLRIDTGEIIEGVIAIAEKRDEDALSSAYGALDSAPWRFEAHNLIGDVHYQRAQRAKADHRVDAIAELERADRAYGEALVTGRSSTDALRGACQARAERLMLAMLEEQSPEPFLAGTRAACGALRQALPEDSTAFVKELQSLVETAMYREEHGLEAQTVWDAALRLIDQSEGAQQEAIAWTAAASARVRLAELLGRHGKDPSPQLERALPLLERAIAADEYQYVALTEKALAYRLLAVWRDEHGLDPSAAFQDALAAAQRALPFAPDRYGGHDDLATIYRSVADWKRGHGMDPHADVEAALRELALANQTLSVVDDQRCTVLLILVEYETSRADAEPPSLGRAHAACDPISDKQPDDPHAWYLRVLLELAEAEWLVDHGREPLTQLRSAGQHLERTLRLAPDFPTHFELKARIARGYAVWDIAAGHSPLANFARATQACAAAIGEERTAINLTLLGELEVAAAKWKYMHSVPWAADARSAHGHLDEARQLDPELGYTRLHTGELQLLEAKAANGPLRQASLDAARASLEAAKKLDAGLVRQAAPLLAELDRLR